MDFQSVPSCSQWRASTASEFGVRPSWKTWGKQRHARTEEVREGNLLAKRKGGLAKKLLDLRRTVSEIRAGDIEVQKSNRRRSTIYDNSAKPGEDGRRTDVRRMSIASSATVETKILGNHRRSISSMVSSSAASDGTVITETSHESTNSPGVRRHSKSTNSSVGELSMLSSEGSSQPCDGAEAFKKSSKKRVSLYNIVEVVDNARLLASERLQMMLDEVASLRKGHDAIYPQVLMKENLVAIRMHEMERYSEAEHHYREVLSGCIDLLGPKHPYSLTSMHNLAELLAQRHQSQDEHGVKPADLQQQGGLARTLQLQRFLIEAEQLFKDALKGRRFALGDRHIDTLASANCLGVLLQAQGRMEEAEPYFREAYDGRSVRFGRQNLDTLQTAANLSGVLQHMGYLDEAEELDREALEGRRQLLGEQHPDTLQSANNLGDLLVNRNCLDEGEKLLRMALDGRREIFGELHVDTLTTANNLAALLRARGLCHLEESEQLFREALAGRRLLLGDFHPHTLQSANNLAALLHTVGNTERSEALFREVLAGRRHHLGDLHLDTLSTANNLALLLSSTGQLTESESLCREALQGHSILLGHQHPYTLTSANNLAGLLRATNRLEEAETIFRETLAGRKDRLGFNHPDTLMTANNLSLLLQSQGRLPEAMELMCEILLRCRTSLGDSHLYTLTIINNYAGIVRQMGAAGEAEDLLREALAGLRVKLGSQHEDTIKTAQNLASLLAAEARFDEAKELAHEVLEARWKKLGNKHAETVACAQNVALIGRAKERHVETMEVVNNDRIWCCKVEATAITVEGCSPRFHSQYYPAWGAHDGPMALPSMGTTQHGAPTTYLDKVTPATPDSEPFDGDFSPKREDTQLSSLCSTSDEVYEKVIVSL